MPVLVIFTSRLSFWSKGGNAVLSLSLYTQSVFTDLEDCDDSNKRDRRPYYEVFLPDRFIIRYESKFLACCFAFFKSEHVYVERETSATVSRVPRQLRFR